MSALRLPLAFGAAQLGIQGWYTPIAGVDSSGNPKVPIIDSGGRLLTAAEQQQFTTSSSSTPGTANATVFTLAAGQRGFIQNLDDAALAVKYGASCSTSDFTFILKAGSAADDGNGGSCVIDDWTGAVSVCAMTGTARYLATKLS